MPRAIEVRHTLVHACKLNAQCGRRLDVGTVFKLSGGLNAKMVGPVHKTRRRVHFDGAYSSTVFGICPVHGLETAADDQRQQDENLRNGTFHLLLFLLDLPERTDSIPSTTMIHLPLILLFSIGGTSLHLGGPEGFEAHLAQLKSQYDEMPNGQVAYRLAVGYASRGRVEDTVTWLVRARTQGVDQNRVDLCLGDAHLAARSYEHAIRFYVAILDRLPSHYGALRRLWEARLTADLLPDVLDLKRIDSILESHGFPVVKLANKADPQGARFEVDHARKALRLNRLDEAERRLRRAIGKHWLASDSYRMLSELWRVRGESEKRHGALSIYLEFAIEPNQLYRRALRVWTNYERRGKRDL